MVPQENNDLESDNLKGGKYILMRIVFIDMHCNVLLTRPYSQIRKGTNSLPPLFKHKFILDYAHNNNIELYNFLSGEDSTLRGYRHFKKYDKYKRIAHWEHNYVMKHSFSSELRIQAITDPQYIRDDDIVIGYIERPHHLNVMSHLNGHHVLMGNHFISINHPIDLKQSKIEAFINEIDLSKNAFVNKYFNLEGVKQIVCPYVYGDRFKNLNQERKNKMLAIGTLSTCSGHPGYRLYRSFFNTEWIQPMRKEIFDQADKYKEEIDSYISYIYEDKKVINKSDGWIEKKIKALYNKYNGFTQVKYASFNMVKKFNEYKFFACPEELVGMPGIGFVEGMACGTAYIGVEGDIYESLGLKAGEHYIGYDGTFEDLIDKIHYCQQHPNEIEKIAQTGMNYVRKHFNANIVASNLFKELAILLNE